MLFGLCCQREGLCKALYIVHVFILIGVIYYYFQKSVGKTAPDSEIAEESSQPIGETLRPVWGLMDKCYPVTTQRHKVNTGKKQASGEKRRCRQRTAVCPSEVENKEEEGPGSWGPQLLKKFWPGWFPAVDTPKMQNHE
ncbi:hypothetical protein H1C71_012129 [Ictidomys tridecemlineatus]|nr:hypothetical protein H1C71_012129 [Ictidomys tridecemlineatus]